MNQNEFSEDMRRHVSDVLLNDRIMAVAYHANINRDEFLDVLHPLITNLVPFRVHKQLHARLPAERQGLSLLDGLARELTTLDTWREDRIKTLVLRVAQEHDIGSHVVREVCGILILFGPSPLDPYRCMEALGPSQTCFRCEIALQSFRENHMVG